MRSKILHYRQQLKELQLAQRRQFAHGTAVTTLLQQRTQIIDQMIIEIGKTLELPDSINLIALGGYGRKELYPHSDIDLLILYPKNLTEQESALIEQWVAFLWDMGLILKQTVCDLTHCKKLAVTDLFFFTSLIDSRLLTGNAEIFVSLKSIINEKISWTKDRYLSHRLEETSLRQQKYFLENCDIKNIFGGLRDLQILQWLTLYFFDTKEWSILIKYKLLTAAEYEILSHAFAYLQKLRFALHLLQNSDKFSESLTPKFKEINFPESRDFCATINNTQPIIKSLLSRFSEIATIAAQE